MINTHTHSRRSFLLSSWVHCCIAATGPSFTFCWEWVLRFILMIGCLWQLKPLRVLKLLRILKTIDLMGCEPAHTSNCIHTWPYYICFKLGAWYQTITEYLGGEYFVICLSSTAASTLLPVSLCCWSACPLSSRITSISPWSWLRFWCWWSRRLEDEMSYWLGPVFVKLMRLFMNLAISIHLFSCAYWRIKVLLVLFDMQTEDFRRTWNGSSSIELWLRSLIKHPS